MSTRDSRWQQVSLWCEDWRAAEQTAIAHLGPLLTGRPRDHLHAVHIASSAVYLI